MKYILSAVSVLFFSSCSYHYTALSNRSLVPIKPSQVTVYMDKDKVPKKSEDIGVIIAKTNNQTRTIRKAKKYAAAHGANGIYWQEKKDIGDGAKVMNALLATGIKGKYTLIATYTTN